MRWWTLKPKWNSAWETNIIALCLQNARVTWKLNDGMTYKDVWAIKRWRTSLLISYTAQLQWITEMLRPCSNLGWLIFVHGTYFCVDLMLINMAPRPGQDSAQLDHIQRVDTRNKKSVAPLKRLQYKVQKQVSFEEPCVQKQVSFEEPCEFEDLNDEVGTSTVYFHGLCSVISVISVFTKGTVLSSRRQLRVQFQFVVFEWKALVLWGDINRRVCNFI